MSSKRRRCRTGKKRFHDQDEAKRALTLIRSGEKRFKTPVRCYECPFCGGWHLTSREEVPLHATA